MEITPSRAASRWTGWVSLADGRRRTARVPGSSRSTRRSGNTVEQVEQVSQGVKRAVTRPVREVNGIAAGVAAAVSTLVKGPRKSSVDSATQDEEMFI